MMRSIRLFMAEYCLSLFVWLVPSPANEREARLLEAIGSYVDESIRDFELSERSEQNE